MPENFLGVGFLVVALLFCPIFFLLGVDLFIGAFRAFREYRLLADMPEPKIRGLAMGRVEIRGRPRADRVLTSPVSRVPCVWYKVEIYTLIAGAKPDVNEDESWHYFTTDSQGGETFYLEDETGRVQIRLQDAELDLTTSPKRLVRVPPLIPTDKPLPPSAKASPATPSTDPDAELQEYLCRLTKASWEAKVQETPSFMKAFAETAAESAVNSGGTFRVREQCIFRDHWYDVTGTCMENPAPKDAGDRNLIAKGLEEPTFLISDKKEKKVESDLRKKAAEDMRSGVGYMVVSLAVFLVALHFAVR